MIKAEDLRIGDLVQHEGSIAKVVEVYEKNCLLSLNNKYVEAKPKDIEGIPISNDTLDSTILENNGWEEDKYGNMWKMFDYQKIEYFNGSVSSFFHIINDNVRYVHELQHILWALGEDANFKI